MVGWGEREGGGREDTGEGEGVSSGHREGNELVIRDCYPRTGLIRRRRVVSRERILITEHREGFECSF